MTGASYSPPSALGELGRLQPFAVVGGEVHATLAGGAGEPPPARAFFMSALGDKHPLACLGRFGDLGRRHARVWLPRFRAYQRNEARRLGPPHPGDPVELFLWMVARLEARQTGIDAWSETDVEVEACGAKRAEEAFLRLAPPALADPCVVVDGRVHALRRCLVRRHSGPAVILPQATYTVMTNSRNLNEYDREWQRRVHDLAVAGPVLAVRPVVDAEAVARARAEIASTGHLERGPLIFLREQEGPRLGHLLPAHTDRHFHRQRRAGEVAVTHPISGNPSIGAIRPVLRVDGAWKAYRPSLSTCLGTGPSPYQMGGGGALSLPLFLRWCAVRVASNGAWHE